MGQMLEATKRLIYRHAITASYKSTIGGTYNVSTGQVVNGETTYTPKIYKKHVKATTFYQPSMIGKEISLFYLVATDIPVRPKVGDKIVYASDTFIVDSFTEHIAEGAVCAYVLLGVKA